MGEKIKILVLGDSHARSYFSCRSRRRRRWKTPDMCMNGVQSHFRFRVKYVSGATAQGAVNPSSKTKALSVFRGGLSKINSDEYDYIAIMLGEVDCGFVIWYRAEKYSISIDEQLNLSVNNLFDFIHDEVLSKFEPNQVIVMGSVLPTIKDDQDWGEVCHLRRSIKATQLERTELTFRYNSMLEELSDAHGYNYIDITDETLDKNTNLVGDEFLNENKLDHHLSFKKIWKFWISKLTGIVK